MNLEKTKIVLAFSVIYLVWGSTYLAIRFGLESLPPILLAGTRFFTGGLLLSAWLFSQKAKLPRSSVWLPTAAIGIPFIAISYGLLFTAQQAVPSGLASMFFAMTPVWMVLLDWIRPNGVRPQWPVIVGIGFGIMGVGFLVNPSGLPTSDGVSLGGAVLLLISTISWASSSIYSRHIPQPTSKTMSTAIMMISGGIVLLLVSWLKGEIATITLASITLKSGLALFYLIITALIGLLAYNWLLSVTSPARIATYAFINPVIAVFLGILMAEETLSPRTVVCSIMIISAVMMIVLNNARYENKAGIGFENTPISPGYSGKDEHRESVNP